VGAECVPEIFATHLLSCATNTKVRSTPTLNPCESLKSVSSTYTPTLAGLMAFVNSATVLSPFRKPSYSYAFIFRLRVIAAGGLLL
jgi:hypothetical protein